MLSFRTRAPHLHISPVIA